MKIDKTKTYYMIEIGPKGLKDQVITMRPKKHIGDEMYWEAVDEEFIIWDEDFKAIIYDLEEGYTWFVFEKRSDAMTSFRMLKMYRKQIYSQIRSVI